MNSLESRQFYTKQVSSMKICVCVGEYRFSFYILQMLPNVPVVYVFICLLFCLKDLYPYWFFD